MRGALPFGVVLLAAACGPRVVAVAESGESSGGTESTGTSSTTGRPDSDTTTESSGSGETSMFVPPMDAGEDISCDVFENDCPEGEKCTWYATSGYSWDAQGCFPILGDGVAGEPCQAFGDNPGVSGLDDCADGHFCWDVDEDTATGYCAELCQGSWGDANCDTGICAIWSSFALCLPTCDPLQVPSNCPNPDNVCIADPGGLGFACSLDASGGLGIYKQACQYVNSCNQGLFCANANIVPDCAGSQGCCTYYCDLNQPACPDEELGVECVPYYDEPPPGYEHVGACVVPE